MAKTYTSAIERLRELPETFTGSDLTVKFQWSAALASSYLANWRKAGLVRSLGGHSDVHMNLLANRRPNIEQALRRAFPNAIKVGADILREAGWTTQIQRMPEVAVESTSPRYKLVDFTLVARSPGWFEAVRPGSIDPVHGMRRLKPAWALADMIDRFLDRRVKNSWLLAPDDLDLDAAADDPESAAALSAFGLPATSLSQSGYAQIYDEQRLDELQNPSRPRERAAP